MICSSNSINICICMHVCVCVCAFAYCVKSCLIGFQMTHLMRCRTHNSCAQIHWARKIWNFRLFHVVIDVGRLYRWKCGQLKQLEHLKLIIVFWMKIKKPLKCSTLNAYFSRECFIFIYVHSQTTKSYEDLNETRHWHTVLPTACFSSLVPTYCLECKTPKWIWFNSFEDSIQ